MITTSDDAAPWLSSYGDGMPFSIQPPHDTMLDVFNAAIAAASDQPAIRYFDGLLTFADLDEAADALAAALMARGYGSGDRLALYVQNNPSFIIGLIAAWKIGGIAVAVNPMNKQRELTHALIDSDAMALICLDSLFYSVVQDVIDSGAVPQLHTVITTSANDFQTRNDPRVLEPIEIRPDHNPLWLNALLTKYRGRHPSGVLPKPDDAAVLTYTSGTTGIPKAAINTHRSMSFNSYTYRRWVGLSSLDAILAIAPLFHITGLVGHVGAALASPCPLVLTHRFDPTVVLDAIREHRPTFTVAAITALTALLAHSADPAQDFDPLRAIYSGGAPVSPTLADDFQRRTGRQIHNIYGLTETTSPSHATPLGAIAPIDPRTGALSVGLPVFNTAVRVLDQDDEELPAGHLGEIAIKGPQVIPGYWNRPEDSAQTIVDGELRTGDIGYMDDQGWFYIVDRKKDMINASGYKVWPREVEDVLYTHAAIREAAVVGMPDPYRGETVKAFVSLKQGACCSPSELIEFCKKNMAAYKYPRELEIVDQLPKTSTGKILRRTLRESAQNR
ncbi:AMP-binding protein [Mycobacterium sp. 1465703.0]|uniref:AMP-binding protein n=1 Tax=Mycobacterium sp. 1465703.0 TaxID=1834078 RepID=UPI000801EA01|nr:AMP-binding protein [Mycobacterium sp. 1465703.0]OBJ08834.1 acyl-CoA synthetase [Mycobacterium sp. 1465703.0]